MSFLNTEIYIEKLKILRYSSISYVTKLLKNLRKNLMASKIRRVCICLVCIVLCMLFFYSMGTSILNFYE